MAEWTTTLWVAGGGAMGAYCRYRIADLCVACFGRGFPYGTLLVNVLGSLLVGVLAGAIQAGVVPGAPWSNLIGGGFLGALTTFSTFSMDTFAAFRDGHPVKGGLNIVVNVLFCMAGVGTGFSLFAE